MRWIVLLPFIFTPSIASASEPSQAKANASPPSASSAIASPTPSEGTLKERAASLFDRATLALQRRDFGAAAEDFERAHRLVPNATAAAYALRSYLKANRLDRAALLAETLRESTSEGELRSLCDTVLDEAERTYARVSVDCSRPCTWTLDTPQNDPDAPMAPRWELYLPPGKHSLFVRFANGATARRLVALEPRERREITFDENREPTEAVRPLSSSTAEDVDAPSTAEHRGLPTVYFWSAAALTTAGALLTTASGLDTLYRPGPDRVREECAQGDVHCPLYQEGLDKQRRTNVLLVTTAVLGASTAVLGLFYTNWSHDSEHPTARKKPSSLHPSSAWHLDAMLPSTSGLHLSLRGQF
jgi:hypothetical protein